MRKLALLCLFCCLQTMSLLAQFVPQGLQYQCVVRDASQQPMLNQSVELLFSIRSGASNGPIVYTERHNVNTGTTGLVSLVLGKGQAVVGQFSNINWAGGAKFFQTNLIQGGNPVDLGTTEFQAVPYALHALSAANSSTGDNWGNQSVQTNGSLLGNGTNSNPLQIAPQGANTGQVLKWNGTQWIPQDDISATGTNGGTVTNINTGNGLTGGPISTSGTIGLANTGVAPGAYGSASEIPVLTIDATGRITQIWTAVPSPGTVGIVGGNGIGVQQNGLSFTITNTGDTNPGDDLTNSTTFNGDVSGTSQNLQLKPNIVTTNEILNQTIIGIDINKMDALPGQVLKWNGNQWAPADDNAGAATLNLNAGAGIGIAGTAPNLMINNTGDIDPDDDILTTDVADGDVTGVFTNLQIKPNAVNTAELANSAVTAAKLDDMGAAVSQVLKWNGTAWVPSADLQGTTNITAGSGIAVTNVAGTYTLTNTGDTNPNDDLTENTTFDGDVSGTFDQLLLNNRVVRGNHINQMGATSGEVLKWNGTTWAPAPDQTGGLGGGNQYSAGTAISITGTAPNLVINNVGDISDSNEIQALSLTGNTLSLSNGGGSVTLPNTGGTGNNYNQGTGISVTGTAPNFVINNTGDLSNINEIQQISLSGSVLTLSNGGGTVTLPSSVTGNNYTQGAGITITGTAPNFVVTNAGDLSPTNELQNLQLTGTILGLTGSATTVDLSAIAGSGAAQWAPVAAHQRNTNAGNVLIGKATSSNGKLQVESNQTGQYALQVNATAAVADSAALYVRHAGTGGAISTVGSIGINVGKPEAPLHIRGVDSLVVLEAANPTIGFRTPSSGLTGKPTTAFAQLNPRGLILGSNADSIHVNLMPNGQAAVMTNAKTGNVGIGNINNELYQLKVFAQNQGINLENAASGRDWEFWVNPAGQLVLYNDGLAPGTPAGVFDVSGVYTASDRRLKQDIKPLSADALSKVLALQPVTYAYLNQQQQMPGLIAQEVQKILPELVKSVSAHNGNTDYLTVNYSALTPVIIKAMQEQQSQIDAQKQQIDALMKRLDALEKK
jgi:trimeric autotransporter adhesin